MSAAEVMMKAWQNIGHVEVIPESTVKGEKIFLASNSKCAGTLQA
jgi:hypothetical protein